MTTIGNVSANDGEFRKKTDNFESHLQIGKKEDDFIWAKYDKVLKGGNRDGKIDEKELNKALDDYFKSKNLSYFASKYKDKIQSFVEEYKGKNWSEITTSVVKTFILATDQSVDLENTKNQVEKLADKNNEYKAMKQELKEKIKSEGVKFGLD